MITCIVFLSAPNINPDSLFGLGNNDKGSLVYNVRLQLRGEEPREGAHTEGFYKKHNVKFVILYTDGVKSSGEYRVLHVKDTAPRVSEERMKEIWYPYEPKGNYFFYRFDEEVTVGKLRIADLIVDLQKKHQKKFGAYTPGEPLFTTAKELLHYRDSL